MSRVRVHNFSVSLDGFGTGEGLSRHAPFGHAGQRLHEWMFAWIVRASIRQGRQDEEWLRPKSEDGRSGRGGRPCWWTW